MEKRDNPFCHDVNFCRALCHSSYSMGKCVPYKAPYTRFVLLTQITCHIKFRKEKYFEFRYESDEKYYGYQKTIDL